jgi:hypothetical protein
LQASGLLDDLGWGDDSEKSFCTSSEITNCHNGWRVQNFIKDTYIHGIGSDFLSDTICCIGVVCDTATQVGGSHPDVYDLFSRRVGEPQASPVVCYGIYGVGLSDSQGMSIRASNHPAGFAAVNMDLTSETGVGTMFGIGATSPGMTNVLVKDFVWDGPGPTISAGPVADCVCENILSAGGLVAAGYVVR